MDSFLAQLPKIELHLHIEGTLEPEMMFKLADRNAIQLPYASPEELKAAYQFENLQEFLNLYYQGMSVLKTKEDFYELAMAYFSRCDKELILHHEIFFDPQAHLKRGVSMATMLEGLLGAQQDAQLRYGASGGLIFSLLRHLPESDGLDALHQAKPWQHKIIGIGLDSSELGYPPETFKRAYELADEYGWHRVAHAGEEGPPAYIWNALKELNVSRIDHGVRAIEDQRLVDYLIRHQVPLTICPLSNIKLGVFPDLVSHNLKQLLELGVCVTLNSDDPAYFGGYMGENMQAVQDALQLSQEQWIQLTQNSIQASFAPAERKQALYQRLQRSLVEFKNNNSGLTHSSL